ncbi:MAG: bacillithiol biosynthesis BshC, partial [Chitinophagaceae bacterium]|nr:bacillithiol biosynthesis BshC [Chitinophagaceae bacterium]
MEIHCTHIPYEQTGFFSKIVIDYINQSEQLQPFYQHPVSIEGIEASIKARQSFPTNRKLLVSELEKQYAGLSLSIKQEANLQSLLSKNTFTITTAHQPNIFTGPLYFIYKIIHAI